VLLFQQPTGKVKVGISLFGSVALCPSMRRNEAGGWAVAQGEPGKQPVALAKSINYQVSCRFLLLADFNSYTSLLMGWVITHRVNIRPPQEKKGNGTRTHTARTTL
jgi:hypothetical protein